MPKEYQLGKLTRREFRERMNSGELGVCILPIAAVEQHLEHLAMEQDWRSVSNIASRVARNLAPAVIVAEAIMVGISEHHMSHHGTLTLRPGTFLTVLNDLIRSLNRAGFSNILVLNGHGGNVQPCRAAWDQFVREFQINLEFMSYWDVLNQEDARELLSGGNRLPQDLPGHAQEFETSIALCEFEENVRREEMGRQTDRAPLMAAADTGAQFMSRIEERITEHVRQMLAGERQVEVPPFHP